MAMEIATVMNRKELTYKAKRDSKDDQKEVVRLLRRAAKLSNKAGYEQTAKYLAGIAKIIETDWHLFWLDKL